jgi:hypothetical protein
MKDQIQARRGSDEVDDIVVRCDSMGQCLKVVSEWMLHGVQSGYIRVVFADGADEDILAEWRLGFDSSLGRDDWSFVL